MDYGLLSRRRPQLMGVAMVWVMLFHASNLDFGLPLLNLGRKAGFGGVDLFILLSAMGLAMSLSRREQSYEAFMSRRAGRIFPAYLVVMVPWTLWLILARDVPWAALLWNSTLLYYWTHTAGSFNWYVSGIMLFYALTPLCFGLLRRSRNRERLTALGILAGLGVCQVLTHEEYWQYTDFFYRVPVFFLGLLLGLYVVEGRRLGRRALAFWGGMLVLGFAYVGVSLTAQWITWPIHFPECHFFLFLSVPLCLGLAWALERLPLGALNWFLGLVGRNSLEIYLLNVTLFTQLEEEGAPFGLGMGYYLLAFGANILLGCLLHRAVEGLRALWSRDSTPSAVA
ncbi:acyltransferase [Pseudoflavonifractor sp. AF19-9AC]|uniref:acyltransferase family protein n=1 Tax=Pseudoflavonifractor sp. AF19-9AC TaxID=2292244 RepID=UPI000E4A8B7D|nr:acyltransferase family protein [Pseudoflavonifractor sp. AF19-9AC]RHR10749.1 acyltransferase [Pseudoflavonifractor sp. AF19-9AC]